MFTLQANPELQRLTIVSDQALSPEEMKQLIAAMQAEAAKLRPGWVAAVDFRGMWVSSPFVNEQFRQLQEALLTSGAAKIGTLLDSDSLKMRLWQSGKETKSNLVTRRFHKLDEWEAFLSES